MLKRIIALLLCAFTLVSVTACGGEESSEASKDEASKTDTSATDSSAGDTSGEDSNNYVDKEGYEQFLKVAAIDELLAERGYKDKGANSDYVPLNYDKMKAMWISQFDFNNVYFDGRKQRSESQFKDLVEKAYDNLVSLGFNTVIVQVRPNTDCFYPSAYYPYSHYVLGSYGKNATYDPIKIMVELAHEKGLSFHAWINPMRGMSAADLAKVDDVYPVASWTAISNMKRCAGYLYSRQEDGLYYLNIAYEEVRKLIIDAAAEIIRNYDVDGLHMDDYFYFGEVPSFDIDAFNAAKAENPDLTRQEFRYTNLNTLISGIYSAVKEENKNVIFGISPAGNLNSMATTYYADVETWLSEDGYVDYIMPQIYFGMEHSTWGYADTYERWSKVTTNPNIKFIPGLTLGKAVDGSSGKGDPYAGAGVNEWIDNKDVFKKCFEYSVNQSNFGGYAIFCYKYLWNPLSGAPIEATEEELENCKDYFTDIIKGEPIKY